MDPITLTLDGSEAAARIAHACNEIIAIYPITPASVMGELADAWSAEGQTNLWGQVPRIIEMQSEAGAAGALHGALQLGALATTFTASQGLLLMLPNMYKIAGELSPTVFHIAARSLAAQALSIFCDHSDVMAARATGFAILAANSVQEVQDMALIAQAVSLKSRIPVLHFFDGFRTSHEVSKIELVSAQTMQTLLDEEAIQAHRARALNPEHPVIRGTSQNPDVYFQGRESVNPFYTAFAPHLEQVMQAFAQTTGRSYQAYEYYGSPDADALIVLMGSAVQTVQETLPDLQQQGRRCGLLAVRMFRPLDAASLLAVIPKTVRRIAVLDRCKEPGSLGEPLFLDIQSLVAQDQQSRQPHFATLPRIIGGRYGLSSKEFTPGMVKAVFDELDKPEPQHPFSIGIYDDVSHLSLDWETDFRTQASQQATAAIFYGLGSDGTVSANKNSIKIIGDHSALHVQGYFVYDSKKSGAVTISHLRFSPQPILSAYLIQPGEARFVACHQSHLLKRFDPLIYAAQGAVFLLNSALPPEAIWDSFSEAMQQQLLEKEIQCYVIDAYALAEELGMGRRINTIMQSCFFAITQLLPLDQALIAMKQAAVETYGGKGQALIEQNAAAIDQALLRLSPLAKPSGPLSQTTPTTQPWALSPQAPEFVQQVSAKLLAGLGDRIPVSQIPCDGTWPSATAQWEKRGLALEIPQWDQDLCIQCGKCPLVCPHSAIRSKIFTSEHLEQAPDSFLYADFNHKEMSKDWKISYQVAPEDCTGCGLCVEICPIKDKTQPGRRALNMQPLAPLLEMEKHNWEYFLSLPEVDRRELRLDVIKEAMLTQPLFEFSGACSGCGETPYLRLASQLFGERMVIANATGCSSIYGGNLPTTPWSQTLAGRGPAWNNSLFEDNAEFGLGMRLAINQRRDLARQRLQALRSELPELDLAPLFNEPLDEAEHSTQRQALEALQQSLRDRPDHPEAQSLLHCAEDLLARSVWIIGGDGWAYDIGFGGLDHVLASGEKVNILVLDTEVYSNTGGQTSKATPRGAVAKFSAGGKASAKKDLAQIAMTYEGVYVAQVAYGAKDLHTLKTFLEAETFPGPALIIAYSPCIAWGNDLAFNHQMQDRAVRSGHWPLFRYDPRRLEKGLNPLQLDSKPPNLAYREFTASETRFNMLWRSHEAAAEHFLEHSQKEARAHYHHYQQLSELDAPAAKEGKPHDSEG
ncbi:pyruvate:ferredoxin (flavodoxin) oxidoreductase [Nitrincola tapanii]|uniref:Pyruvate-flavodoxin oxidoreductase n=1 Tax=Nitrincola tapanii TaxID=1708751 RepID=A0A5A9W4Q3_9GAMM|nr:pyruvate:ferredoxin (flavodoxin) oxidoreductase [Nitrincola tapanii]KAA0875474.1 pyruvate:ferredoxin (flavodoxin) oxidoreductase [Nitrincola tapanii]